MGVEGAGEAFGFDAAFEGGVLAEEAEGEAADGGEVGTAVAIWLSARVFVEGDVENPVLAIFNRPVFADRVGERLGLRRQAADVEAGLPMLFARYFASGNDDSQRAQVGPIGSARMIGGDFHDMTRALVEATVSRLRGGHDSVLHVGEIGGDGLIEELLHVGFQPRLIPFQREDVMPLLRADLLDDLRLTPHRIDGHRAAF